MSKVMSLIKSRRFHTAVIGVVVVVSSHYGLELNQTELLSVSAIISSWIFGDSIRETK